MTQDQKFQEESEIEQIAEVKIVRGISHLKVWKAAAKHNNKLFKL